MVYLCICIKGKEKENLPLFLEGICVCRERVYGFSNVSKGQKTKTKKQWWEMDIENRHIYIYIVNKCPMKFGIGY